VEIFLGKQRNILRINSSVDQKSDLDNFSPENIKYLKKIGSEWYRIFHESLFEVLFSGENYPAEHSQKKRKGSGARTTTKNVYSTEPHKKKKLPGEFKISRNNHIGKARPPTLRRSVSEMELKVQRGGVSRGGESRGGESRGMQSRGLHTPRKEARGASLSPRGRVNRKSLESDSKTSGEKKKGRWLVDDL